MLIEQQCPRIVLVLQYNYNTFKLSGYSAFFGFFWGGQSPMNVDQSFN